MKKSAYFSNSEENSSVTQNMTKEQSNTHSQHVAASAHQISGIAFPYNKSVLWNREVVSFPKFLKASDVIPALFLSPNDVRVLLRQLVISSNNNSRNEVAVTTTHYCGLPDTEKNMIGSPFLGIPSYLFTFCRNGAGYRNDAHTILTVPIVQNNASGDSASKHIHFEEATTL